MPFAQRDKQGRIIALFSEPRAEAQEEIPASDEAVLAFLLSGNADRQETKSYLSQTDDEMIRVVEDVIDLLIKKNLILLTDLPDAAQRKLIMRKRLRAKFLLDDTVLVEDDHIL
ncbi:tryptophan synthase subunit beta like protein [Sedimenticola sp.]|uniref:tryptophan synthase subunit beta like protein n=1 Tax=Sedimenticola sp. TaxID=1940285 RepID=UPI003D0FC06B